MPCTTFVGDSAYSAVPDCACIKEWLSEAAATLGKRIAVEERVFLGKRWFGIGPRRPSRKLYTVLIDIGHGEAQIINFAPRDDSNWSINHYVPAQEVTAWLMGIVTANPAARGEGE